MAAEVFVPTDTVRSDTRNTGPTGLHRYRLHWYTRNMIHSTTFRAFVQLVGTLTKRTQ